MRADMKDVLVNEPRRGRARSYPRHLNAGAGDPEALDHLPAREGMRRPYRWKEKAFGEHLRPLLRYLEKQVGRPWDQVWSEVCAQADARSVRGRHLRRHAREYVEEHPLFVGGAPCDCGGRPLTWGFYVDPQGVLRKAPRQPVEAAASKR